MDSYEKEIAALKQQEQSFNEAIESLHIDLDMAEKEVASLKKRLRRTGDGINHFIIQCC